MTIEVSRVLQRRRAERERLIGLARELAARLDPQLGCRAVAVYGPVARGDINVWSDVDVLVVADRLPAGWAERIAALGPLPAMVEPVAWTVEEFRSELRRNNPIARYVEEGLPQPPATLLPHRTPPRGAARPV